VKVLITGAAGFLGSWFLDHFIREGFANVWTIDIQPHPAGLPMDQQDLPLWLSDFEEDVDLAIHLAAPGGGRMLTDYNSMHVADAFRIDAAFFQWAAKHAQTVVYASGASAYPLRYQDSGVVLFPLGLGEELAFPDSVAFGQPDGLLGFTKLAGEQMAYGAAVQHGLNVLVIRPFSGYGPYQSRDHAVTGILTRAIARENPLVVWGSGSQVRDYIYVTDIVGATMAKVEDGVRGFEILNVASGKGVAVRTIAEMAAGIVGYRPDIVFDDSRPEGPSYRVGGIERLRRVWKPEVDLIDGLRYTADHLRSPKSTRAPLEGIEATVSSV
jgi:nucleoside-diphosphate-sugar epimerase